MVGFVYFWPCDVISPATRRRIKNIHFTGTAFCYESSFCILVRSILFICLIPGSVSLLDCPVTKQSTYSSKLLNLKCVMAGCESCEKPFG